jgi:hypothetical protein
LGERGERERFSVSQSSCVQEMKFVLIV